MSYTLYFNLPKSSAWREIEPYPYFYINCDGEKDNPIGLMQYSDFVWKESSKGVQVIKDSTTIAGMRFFTARNLGYITTEDEHKEFMWIKLRSQNYYGQI